MNLLTPFCLRWRVVDRTPTEPLPLGFLRIAILWTVCTLATALDIASAQQNAVTVQLPTFRFFSVSTTVSVPDRGGAALGGIGRSALGASQFGPAPRPAGVRAFGVERQAQNAHAFVQVHDFRDLEHTLIHDAHAANGARAAQPDIGRFTVMRPGADAARDINRVAGANHSTGSNNASNSSGSNSLAVRTDDDTAGQRSVTDWKRLHAQQAAAQQREVLSLIERARSAAASGNRGAARVYLNMAYRKADDDLRSHVAAEVQRLENSAVDRLPR